MHKLTYFDLFIILFFSLTGCTNEHLENKSGEKLAKTYCASCHLFPEPSLLDKATWEKDVLPPMGQMLGLKYVWGDPYEDIQVTNKKSDSAFLQSGAIALEDWKKIIAYYKSQAPDTLPSQKRLPIKEFTNIFTTKAVVLQNSYPSTTYLKIDPGNKWIYAADGFDSSLNIYDPQLHKIAAKKIHGVIVDAYFNEVLQQHGARSGVFTNIGIMNPNDLTTGSADIFNIPQNGSSIHYSRILDSMHRPVQTTKCDLNKDGQTDYLVCGFGNKVGEFYWMKNNGHGSFDKKILWSIPGAIKAYVDDYNKDGLPDIMVLFAQAQEGIYLFINKGNGEFERKDLLRFPPIYGSCYFELDDFNNDGYRDILYACGDNSDYSGKVLKNYHGVYIFLNDGRNNFKQKYFFPIHGCYKAIAKDFNKDGDLDIAAISFFPDKKNQPQESFVYLENKGNFQFSPYTIPEFHEGNWLTMDAGDVDGDGDDDIVIGNLVPPNMELKISSEMKKTKPAFLLLVNKTK